MRLLTREEQIKQQKKKEARTKAHNRRIQKEGLLPQVSIEQDVAIIAARRQFIKEIKTMIKTATQKPKEFTKRTDAYTAWLITFGYRWVTAEEVKHWKMWGVFDKLHGYMNFNGPGLGRTKLKTPEELDP